MLDYLGEAPERAGLQPGDRPVPLLEPQREFGRTLAEIGREAAEARLAQRLGRKGYGLEAVFRDPEAATATLRASFDRSDGTASGVARLLATQPETFGSLRGRRRLLLGDDRERREARAALPKAGARVEALLREWEEAYASSTRSEKRRRDQAQVEIPGLSEAAQAFVTAYRAGSREAGDALIAEALGTEEGRGVLDEFRAVSAAAVKRTGLSRPGADGAGFVSLPGMDRERGLALAETVTAVMGIDHEQERVAREQLRAEIALERQQDQERARRLGLDRGGPGLGW